MSASTLVLAVLILAAIAYRTGRARSFAVVGGRRGQRDLHSLPSYYGMLTALWCALPALLIVGIWTTAQDSIITRLMLAQMPVSVQNLPPDQRSLLLNDIKNVVAGNMRLDQIAPQEQAAAKKFLELKSLSGLAMAVVALAAAMLGAIFTWSRIAPQLRARNSVERIFEWALLACSTLAIFTTIGILLSVLFESIRFFQQIPIWDFIFGTEWSPQTAIRADQVGSSGAFGAVPLFVGTLLISAIAMVVAVPVGLFSAIYLAEYAHPRFRTAAKPLLEILAGIPTVVYGFFAALTVGPWLREVGAVVGLNVASGSALAAGLVMGVMIIPFVSSLSDDMITAVPQSLRDGSYALGGTRSETIRRVVLRAALPGIVGGVLLAVSRAIGETMIVVMAAGLSANMTANPLEAVTTVTVQIVTLLVGDQEFDSAKTLAAFALGLVLFLVTLGLNVIALHVVRKYREQYE